MIWHAQRHDIVSLLWYSLVLSFNSQLNAAVFHGSGSTPRSTQHEAPKKSVDQQCWDIQRWQHNMFESVCKYFLCFNGLKCLKSLIAFFWRHEIVETGRVMCMNLSSWEWNGTGINLTLICLIYKSDMVSEFFIPCWIPGWNPSWLKCFCFRWFFHRKLDQQAKNAWTNLRQPMVVVGSLVSPLPCKAGTPEDSVPPLLCLPTKSSAIRNKSCKVPWADRLASHFAGFILGKLWFWKSKS